MMNPAFSRSISSAQTERYVLPQNVMKHVTTENAQSDSGPEFRLQEVYGFEIWMKLYSLGFRNFRWADKRVADICCGTGFLSYHLLQRVHPLSLTLIDISLSEINNAKMLIGSINSTTPTEYLAADVMNSRLPDASFDVIIGNSFLHHFYDVPRALREFNRLLKPGGYFLTLHEPAIGAVAVESGRIKSLLQYLLRGSQYLEDIRYTGNGIAPGGGADVWIFKKQEVISLLKKAGFENTRAADWHILRQFIVARKSLHLNSRKQELTQSEVKLLRRSIRIDAVLSKILPASLFGSFCLAAQKFFRE